MEELFSCDGWIDGVEDALESDPTDEVVWDYGGESPPQLSSEELRQVDLKSDLIEVERLVEMGVLRRINPGEYLSGYSRLSTKVVRDWRKRPTWIRRSRLVAREFKTWTPWTQELFAPASSLGVVHSLMALAQGKGLELVTLDVKDAYLNVPQKTKVIIQVDAALFGVPGGGLITFVLERLLPGQRIAASEWFIFIRDILSEAGLQGFPKEPTLLRAESKSAC